MSTALLTADEAARLRPGERLVIVRAGDSSDRWVFKGLGPPAVAPHDWVALAGACAICEGGGTVHVGWGNHAPCPDCRDGRRIVPLYTECPECGGSGDEMVDSMTLYGIPGGFDVGGPCPKCNTYDVLPTAGHIRVGAGNIEVVPVVDWGGLAGCEGAAILVHSGVVWFYASPHDQPVVLTLDPLPVPGRDFGILIDCVEVG